MSILDVLFLSFIIVAVLFSAWLSGKAFDNLNGWKRFAAVFSIMTFGSWVGVAFSSFKRKSWGWFTVSCAMGIPLLILL